MTGAELWIGPAVVAALVSGLVSLLVLGANLRADRRAEEGRRAKKARDFQVALSAEIAGDLLNMQNADRAQIMADLKVAFTADPHYAPVAPRLAGNPIFTALIPQIHLLPGEVIAPVVHYARLRQTLERFADDLRSDTYRILNAERRLLVYLDFLATYDRLEALAREALESLDRSLGVSRSAAALSTGAQAGDAALPGMQP